MAEEEKKKPEEKPANKPIQPPPIKPGTPLVRNRQKQMPRGVPPGFKGFVLSFQLDPKKILIWVLILFMIGSFIFQARGPVPNGKQDLSQVLKDIKDSKVEKIGVEGESLQVSYKDGQVFSSRKEPQVSFEEGLKAANIDPLTVNYEVKDLSFTKALGNIAEIIIQIG